MSEIYNKTSDEKEPFEPAALNIIIFPCDDIITASRIESENDKDFGGKIYFD